MKEDKYIDDLFEQAKNEPPQLSFEEVATRFESSVATTGSLTVLKEWVFNHLNLNSFIMISIVSSILTALYLIFTPINPSLEVENNISLNTPIEVITKDKDKSTNSTITQESITSSKENIQQRYTQNPVTPLEKIERLGIDIPSIDKALIITELAEKVKVDTLPKLLASKRQNEISSMESVESMKLTESMESIERNTTPPMNTQAEKRNNSSRTRKKQTNAGYGFTINTDEKKWQEQTKVFQKEFDIGPDGITKIINGFGKVQVQPWNKNKAKIEVVVTVSANKYKKIEEVLGNVSVDFTHKDQLVKAETAVVNRKKMRWNNRINWKVSIDYMVFVPQSSTIDINHHHGEIVIGEFLGKTNLMINHVDFSAEHIGEEARIRMGHGKGIIKNGGNIFGDLLHSEIKAEQLGNVDLDLGHSTFEANKTGDISGKTLHGKIKIGQINNYNLKGTGGTINIEKAQKVSLNHRNIDIFIGNATDIIADLEHSKFRSKELGNVTLDLKHSNFEAQKAGNIKGTSTQGKINLGIIDRYENNSHGTKVDIKKVNTVKTKGHTTKLTISEVVADLAIDFEFGKCTATINNLSPHINLLGNKAHFDLKIPANAQFQFDMTANTKNYSFPKNIQLKRQIEKTTHHEAEGFSGDSTVQNILKADLLWGKFELEKN